jgi:hypothetical protein
MNRAQRLTVSLIGVAAGVLAVLALTLAGPYSGGPIARLLSAAGSVVSGAEQLAVRHYRGRAREAHGLVRRIS